MQIQLFSHTQLFMFKKIVLSCVTVELMNVMRYYVMQMQSRSNSLGNVVPKRTKPSYKCKKDDPQLPFQVPPPHPIQHFPHFSNTTKFLNRNSI